MICMYVCGNREETIINNIAWYRYNEFFMLVYQTIYQKILSVLCIMMIKIYQFKKSNIRPFFIRSGSRRFHQNE